MDASGFVLAGAVGIGAYVFGRRVKLTATQADLVVELARIDKVFKEGGERAQKRFITGEEMIVAAEERCKAAIKVLSDQQSKDRRELVEQIGRVDEEWGRSIDSLSALVAKITDGLASQEREPANAPQPDVVAELREAAAKLKAALAETRAELLAHWSDLEATTGTLSAQVEQLNGWGQNVVAPNLQQLLADAQKQDAMLGTLRVINASVEELQEVALKQERTNEQVEVMSAQVQQAFVDTSEQLQAQAAAIRRLQQPQQPQPQPQVQPPQVLNPYPWDDPNRVKPMAESMAAANGFRPPGPPPQPQADGLPGGGPPPGAIIQGQQPASPEEILAQLRSRLLGGGGQ